MPPLRYRPEAHYAYPDSEEHEDLMKRARTGEFVVSQGVMSTGDDNKVSMDFFTTHEQDPQEVVGLGVIELGGTSYLASNVFDPSQETSDAASNNPVVPKYRRFLGHLGLRRK